MVACTVFLCLLEDLPLSSLNIAILATAEGGFSDNLIFFLSTLVSACLIGYKVSLLPAVSKVPLMGMTSIPFLAPSCTRPLPRTPT